MSSATAVSPEKSNGSSDSGMGTQTEKNTFNVLSGKQPSGVDSSIESDHDSADVVIVTGADAAAHLLPLRDDFENVLTFRSIILASGLSGFNDVMNQIYQVSYSTSLMDSEAC